MSVSTHPLRVAALAAQVPERTTSRWLNNKVITLRGNDVTTTGTGNHCGWGRNRILQLAITQALVKHGVSPSAAAKAGLVFSDAGSAGREAGQLYPVAKTVLRLGSTSAEVRNIDFNESVFGLSNDDVQVIVDLNRIVDRVDSVLSKFKH